MITCAIAAVSIVTARETYRAKPIWVLIAIPDRRMRVSNISAYRHGQIPFAALPVR
jgi:hypothetical protein